MRNENSKYAQLGVLAIGVEVFTLDNKSQIFRARNELSEKE
jgi:hypothetical protein